MIYSEKSLILKDILIKLLPQLFIIQSPLKGWIKLLFSDKFRTIVVILLRYTTITNER